MTCIEVETLSEVLKKLGFSSLRDPIIVIGLNPYTFVELNRGYFICKDIEFLKKFITDRAKKLGRSNSICVPIIYIANNVTEEWIARYRLELMYQEDIDSLDIIAIIRPKHKIFSFFKRRCIPLSEIFKEIK